MMQTSGIFADCGRLTVLYTTTCMFDVLIVPGLRYLPAETVQYQYLGTGRGKQ